MVVHIKLNCINKKIRVANSQSSHQAKPEVYSTSGLAWLYLEISLLYKETNSLIVTWLVFLQDKNKFGVVNIISSIPYP